MKKTNRLPALRAMDRANRVTARAAHDAGSHGDGTHLDVLIYWAETCADCHALCAAFGD